MRGVRGRGLLRGLELREEIAADVVNAALRLGLLSNPVRPDIVRFMPPLTVTAEEIDRAVDIIEQALTEVAAS